jgi:hypothetical protein
VYLVAERELTDAARVRAAALWAGEPATVSGLAAAWWHGLRSDPPLTVEISIPLDGACVAGRVFGSGVASWPTPTGWASVTCG